MRGIFLLFFAAVLSACARTAEQPVLRLPEGFKVNIFATGLEDARSLALGPGGIVYVGNRAGDKVYAVQDQDHDGRADVQKVVLEGLDMPNGVAYYQGSLFVAEKQRIHRYDGMDQHPFSPGKGIIVASLPGRDHHGWRYLAIGPDKRLYFSIGAPCNICDEDGFARIERVATDGSGREIVASGIRNSVGFDWDPGSGELWFTDNGRDWLGDDLPPDEINHLRATGEHFGYPWCHGGDIADPDFGSRRACPEFTAPARRLGAHVAPLGIHFYRGNSFPDTYREGAFVAEHGSWNRSTKVGYRVMFLRLKDGQAVGYEPFIQGWLDEFGEVTGRPVDLLTMPDGALLVSDDFSGTIYRVTYQGK